MDELYYKILAPPVFEGILKTSTPMPTDITQPSGKFHSYLVY